MPYNVSNEQIVGEIGGPIWAGLDCIQPMSYSNHNLPATVVPDAVFAPTPGVRMAPADRIVLIDVVVNALGQKKVQRPVPAFYVT